MSIEAALDDQFQGVRLGSAALAEPAGAVVLPHLDAPDEPLAGQTASLLSAASSGSAAPGPRAPG